MSGLERPADTVAWDCRGYWIKGTTVLLTLSDRCMVPRVVGRVEHVAVTGAHVTVDGWHVPMEDVLRVERATVEQKDEYARERKAMAAREREERKAQQT